MVEEVQDRAANEPSQHNLGNTRLLKCVLNLKALVDAFNQEKALVCRHQHSMIVKLQTSRRFVSISSAGGGGGDAMLGTNPAWFCIASCPAAAIWRSISDCPPQHNYNNVWSQSLINRLHIPLAREICD